MLKRSILRAVAALAIMVVPLCVNATEPQLVVNIILGTMRSSDLERYADNLSEGGFRRLMNGGYTFTSAHLDYATTTTAAGIATIATGTQPSTHGVIGSHWWNHTDSSRVSLIGDSKAHPVEFSTGTGSYSPHRLSAPTVGDMLLSAYPNSKNFTVAIDPLSAIVATGHSGVAYWAERNRTNWTTSSAYLYALPQWVKEYNEADNNSMYAQNRWTPMYDATRYHNCEVAVIEGIKNKHTELLSDIDLNLSKSKIGAMCYTPAGNTMLLEFASTLIAQERLASNTTPDLLTIVLDTPRYIAQTYGPESLEYEDMIYRLDKALEEFLTYVYTQVDSEQKIVVVLTAAHGTSPSYNPVGGHKRERFNVRQMEVIVNAFLGARYGSENYVLGFANNALYLNQRVILDKRLSLDTIREEVATFLLQLRGVANSLSASSLRNTSFSEGRTRLLQQSFYPTRSGDVIIDLQPGWTIENNSYRSAADVGYNYDREVPLIIYRGGDKAQVVEREVSIVEIAPTIAHILGIERPWASEARPMREIK